MTFTVTVDVEQIKEDLSPIGTYYGNEFVGTFGLLNLFRKLNIQAIFFLDVGESLNSVSPTEFSNTVKKIKESNNEIGLHIHPARVNFHNSESVAFHSETGFITDYTHIEKRKLLESKKIALERELGYPCTTFRSGSYAIDEGTIDLLKEIGFNKDFSVFWGYSPLMSGNENFGNLGNIPTSGISIVPVTSFLVEIPIIRKQVRKKIDPAWISLREFRKLLSVFPQNANIEFFLHSFSLMNGKTGKPNTFAIKHFCKLVNAAREASHENITIHQLPELKFPEISIKLGPFDYTPKEILKLVLPKLRSRSRSAKKILI